MIEPYVVHNCPAYARHEQMPARIIPTGKLFVMGDNRDNSSDSREWGLVPEKNVLGEPMVVYWSYDAPTARWLDEKPSHRAGFLCLDCGKLLLPHALEPHGNSAVSAIARRQNGYTSALRAFFTSEF